MSSTANQKRRRQARKKRNRVKDEQAKAKAIRTGKIIHEQHGHGMYSEIYAENMATKLLNIIEPSCYTSKEDKIKNTQIYKEQILDLLIYWPRNIEKEECLRIKYDPGSPLFGYFYRRLQRLLSEYYKREMQ
jgi:hypothetical protein